MLEKIIEFFNSNPIKGLILLLVLVATLMYFLGSEEKHEHLDTNLNNNCNINNDNEFYKLFGNAGLINLKCKINDKEYYLAYIDEKSNSFAHSMCANNGNNKCATAIPVLIEKSELESGLAQYISKINNNADACMVNVNAACNRTTPDGIKSCEQLLADCSPKRQFYHDFVLKDITDNIQSVDKSPLEVETGATRRRYNLIGSAPPLQKGVVLPSNPILDQHFMFDDDANVICADAPDVSNVKSNVKYTSIFISERITSSNDGIIRPEGSELKLKLRFETQAVKGSVNLVPMYVGYCDKQKCSDTKTDPYMRICLYPDSGHKYVLEFEPIIVS